MNQTRPASPSRRARPALAALCVLCAFTTWSHAQVPSLPSFGIGDAMREAPPPRPPVPRQAPEPLIVEQPERPMSLPAGETLAVREFKVEGADAIPPAELQAALEPYRGRTLSMAEIEQAAGKVTALYRSRGYLVTRAYVPRQDASAGTLVIRVLVGTYGKLTLKNRSLVGDRTVAGVFAPLQAGTAVSREALERAMLLVGDMPGAALPRLTISPGEAPGTSDFDVDVGEGKRYDAYVLADNQGPRYIGRNRLRAWLDINSPLGIGDRLSVGLTDVGGGKLDGGRLTYGFPLGTSGLRADLSVVRSTYGLAGEYSDLDASGRGTTVEGTLSYPVLRSREQDVSVSLKFAATRLHTEIGAVGSASDRRLRATTLGLQHATWGHLLGFASHTNLDAGLTYGQLDFADPADLASNKAGANTAGSFAHLSLRLAAEAELSRDWRLSGTLSAQKALGHKNLDGIVQMAISGPDGVKAYRQVVAGSNGYVMNLEARYALFAGDGFTHSLGFFTDVGRVYEHDCGCATSYRMKLADVGVGYYVSSKTMFGRVQLVRAAGSWPQELARDSRTRLLFHAGVRF